jgi:hypothetical protein
MAQQCTSAEHSFPAAQPSFATDGLRSNRMATPPHHLSRNNATPPRHLSRNNDLACNEKVIGEAISAAKYTLHGPHSAPWHPGSTQSNNREMQEKHTPLSFYALTKNRTGTSFDSKVVSSSKVGEGGSVNRDSLLTSRKSRFDSRH